MKQFFPCLVGMLLVTFARADFTNMVYVHTAGETYRAIYAPQICYTSLVDVIGTITDDDLRPAGNWANMGLTSYIECYSYADPDWTFPSNVTFMTLTRSFTRNAVWDFLTGVDRTQIDTNQIQFSITWKNFAADCTSAYWCVHMAYENIQLSEWQSYDVARPALYEMLEHNPDYNISTTSVFRVSEAADMLYFADIITNRTGAGGTFALVFHAPDEHYFDNGIYDATPNGWPTNGATVPKTEIESITVQVPVGRRRFFVSK